MPVNGIMESGNRSQPMAASMEPRMVVSGNGAMNQQMAMMQEQIAIMQQTILHQQMMMGPGGGPWRPPPASVAAIPQLSRQSNPILSGAATGAPEAFGFMSKKSEAFDFVCDELSRNKRPL